MARSVVGVVMGGDLADVRLWASELDVMDERFVHRFNRPEPRESAAQLVLVFLVIDDDGFDVAAPDRFVGTFAGDVLGEGRDAALEGG